MLDVLFSQIMLRALIAAAVTGLAAPTVGTYLVQRRLSLLGDGIGRQQREHAGAALLTLLLALALAVGARATAVAGMLLCQRRCRGCGHQHEHNERTAQV